MLRLQNLLAFIGTQNKKGNFLHHLASLQIKTTDTSPYIECMFAMRISVVEVPYFPLKEGVGGLAQAPRAAVQSPLRCPRLNQK